jgi:thiol-disulfide isomerase/thioredoxin
MPGAALSMSSSGFSQSSEAEQQHLPPEPSQWPVWPWLVLLGILVVVMVVRAGLKPAEIAGDADDPRGERHPAVGTALSVFQLQPLTGNGAPLTEADLTAAATLVNFWGPWCPACVVEFPHLVELEKHFRSQPGFQFVSISTNFDPFDEQGLAESTAQFLKRQNADFPTYRDPRAKTTIALIEAAKIKNFGYPATLLLGPGGKIRGLWEGYYEGDEKAIRVAVEKALRENSKKP